MQSKTILIKNDTKQGYLEAEAGDGIDISGRMIYHRGTVQKGLAQTLKCSPEGGGSYLRTKGNRWKYGKQFKN